MYQIARTAFSVCRMFSPNSLMARLWAAIGLLVLAFGAGAEPLSEADDLGNRVLLKHAAQRVVSLSPGITEVLFALGAGPHIIGVSAASDYPVAANALPVISWAGQIDLERLVRLGPDLIVAWPGGYDKRLWAALQKLGIPIYAYQPDSLEKIGVSAQHLAHLLGTESASKSLLNGYQSRLSRLRRANQTKRRIRTFVQIWPQPLMTPGSTSLINDMLDACGANNLFGDIKQETITVSLESVVARPVELIIATEPGGNDHGALKQWQALSALPATRYGLLKTLNADLMERSALRALDATETLCEFVEEARRATP